MRKLSIAFCLFLAAASLPGCKKFLDVNHDPNNLTDASEDLILSPVEETITAQIDGGTGSICINYWMQNMANNQPTPSDVSYVVTNQYFDDSWGWTYTTVLNNLHTMNAEALSNGNPGYAAIAKILTAYSLGYATDVWGDVPYTQAFQGTNKLTPVYDPQESIYKTIQSLLDSAITEASAGTGKAPGSDDFFYAGDMAKWTKLAYSLKARYYMHLTKAPGYDATAQSNLALQALANGMTTYADDCSFAYAGSTTSSAKWYWNFYNQTTATLCSTYVDSLKSRNDPRIAQICNTAANTGLYTGITIGTTGNLFDFSTGGLFYCNTNSNGYVFSADEALFLKAEATFRVSGASAASPIYRTAITNNFLKLGIDTNSTAAQAYLTARGALTDANALQRIIEEKTTANWFSNENWVDWRRTGYPKLTVLPSSVGAAVSEIPRRFLYPQNELTSNPQSIQNAKITDRVWWDAQ